MCEPPKQNQAIKSFNKPPNKMIIWHHEKILKK